MKKFYGWPEDAHFLVPEGVQEHFRDGIGKRGRELRAQWSKAFAEYRQKYRELAERLGVSANTIEARLHRARHRLRVQLAQVAAEFEAPDHE